MTGCRVSTGYDEDTNSCSLCLDSTFSLRADLSEFVSCDGLDGVTCWGANEIRVGYRYWVSGYRQSTSKYITLYQINNSTNDVLISHICAYGQCCDELSGCDYVEYSKKRHYAQIIEILQLQCVQDALVWIMNYYQPMIVGMF